MNVKCEREKSNNKNKNKSIENNSSNKDMQKDIDRADEEVFMNSFIETVKIHTSINKRIDNNKSDYYIRSVNSSGISQTQINNERIKQEIIELLQVSEEPKQIREIKKIVQAHTNQKISALNSKFFYCNQGIYNGNSKRNS